MNTMFNPNGRIGPVIFRNAAFVLIAIGAVFSLLPGVVPSLTMLSFASLLLAYPWAVIWIKRLHDAGKPGWIFVIILAVWLIVSWVVSYVISPPAPPPANPADPSAVMASMTAQMQATAIPATISSVIIALLFVFAGNALLKTDPEENAYDHGSSI